jgi:2-polyprenyl-3-methyl-5-hydroxy-6-metoxy-1,4-benzoquinol methylase
VYRPVRNAPFRLGRLRAERLEVKWLRGVETSGKERCLINPKLKRLVDSLGRDEKFEPYTDRALVLEMIGSDKRVVAFGCDEGDLFGLLAAAGNRVTAIAPDAGTAEAARPSCEDAIVADLEAGPLGEVLSGRSYDVALFHNVLEFVRDARRVLEESRRLLGPGGYAVLAIPNVAHASVRLALLRGRFDVPGSGTLARPVLHFFTLKSIHELCFRAGFRVVAIERTKSPLAAAEFEREILHEIETDPEHDTLQFVIRAAPLGDDERLAALVDIAVDAELRAGDARAHVALVEREGQELQLRLADVQERIAREAASRAVAEAELAAFEARVERAEREASEYERRDDTLRLQTVAYQAEAAALRTALERVNEEVAEARAAAALARERFDAHVARDGAAVADWQARVLLAAGVAEEANRERDFAQAAREAAEAACRHLQERLGEARVLAEERAGTIEDLRFEIEQAATNLRGVLADRERLREAHEVQQTAAAAFFTHVETELARTRREIVHIDGMIRQVQSSRWWTIKRALGKARRIVVAKLRR